MSVPRPKRLSVLLVDDSAIVRKRVRHLLEDQEQVRTVIEAGSGADGWLLFKFFQPDVIVLDLQLPDFDGVEVLRRMKQRRPDCMIIILSNCQNPEVKAECRRQGADCVLHKATEFEALRELLRRGRGAG